MRLLLVILLALSAPYWIAFRQGFGRSFYVALVIANLVGLALMAGLDGLLVPLSPHERASYHAAEYSHIYLAVLQFTWFWHIPAALTGTKYWRRDMKPPSWNAGHFHFWRGAPLLTDAVLFMIVGPSLYYGYVQDPRTSTLILIVASIVSYFFLAALANFNGGVLPFKGRPATPRSRPSPPPKPNQTSLRNMPKSDSEGLEHIFSRRHKALNDIAAPTDD